jgi:hypothetical protein
VIEQHLVERALAGGVPRQLERLAGRGDLQPGDQPAAARVAGDLRVVAGEQLEPQRLDDLLDGSGGQAQPAQRDLDLGHQRELERAQRAASRTASAVAR